MSDTRYKRYRVYRWFDYDPDPEFNGYWWSIDGYGPGCEDGEVLGNARTWRDLMSDHGHLVARHR